MVEKTDVVRLMILVSALKLEIMGMKRKGQSAHNTLKKEYGFKGDKETVLKNSKRFLEEIKKIS